MPAHCGDRLDRFLHLHIDDAYDSFGGVDDAQFELFGDAGPDGGNSSARIQPHLAAEEIVFAEITQHEIAVGDGGFGAPAAITSGPRNGARALRSDLELAEAVDARERAAAG